MKNEARLIGKTELEAFVAAIFAAAGVADAMAAEWARAVVWANLRGVDSHGVLRVPRYVDLLRRKSINPTPAIRVERRAGAVAVLEADFAPGAVAMSRAMAEAIGRAREVHVGWCGARNITHAGAIGYFALQAAQAGMAGIAMCASGPLMAYHGARVAGVSTNPIAIAVPTRRRPFVLDMSTSTAAFGKVMNARDAGTKIPLGWAIDAAGRDTTDPNRVATLLPLGGPKGSGLSLMIECLASLAVGNPLVAMALADASGGDTPVLNGVAIAVDLAALGDAGRFVADADALHGAIAGLARADGVESILLPGERGDAVKAEREANGIPVTPGTWARLAATAKTLGVAVP